LKFFVVLAPPSIKQPSDLSYHPRRAAVAGDHVHVSAGRQAASRSVTSLRPALTRHYSTIDPMSLRTQSATPGSSHRADRVYRRAGRRFDVRVGRRELANFAINAEIQMQDKPIKTVINHAPTPSPLVQTNSFLLDIDLALEQALPTNEKALWETIEGLRSVKNSVFEACITDRTRELFS
jgi:hypothetical protein